ncbi:MAG: hypothetical protein WBC06_03160 [Chitinophagaceae bacterium]
MKIKNIDGLSASDLQEEERKGGRFIYFAYTVSLIVFTFKRTSGVYLVRKSENRLAKGIPFVIISALLGWWGIPFGPKFTLESIRTNMKGGKDVTDEVMATVAGHLLFQESHMAKII